MDQPLLLQKLQCPVNSGRSRIETGFGQCRQQLVRAQWLVALPDQLQHQLTDRCQALASLAANLPGKVERLINAVLVVVIGREGERVSRHDVGTSDSICYIITCKAS